MVLSVIEQGVSMSDATSSASIIRRNLQSAGLARTERWTEEHRPDQQRHTVRAVPLES